MHPRSSIRTTLLHGDASVVTTLSWDIVKTISEPRGGWREVETAAGQRGWLPLRTVRSPIDYRAGFHRVDGAWRMAALVAGD